MDRSSIFASEFVRYAGNESRNKTHFRHKEDGWNVVSTSLHSKWDNAEHPANHDGFTKRSDLDVDRWMPEAPMQWDTFQREVREATYEFDELGYRRFIYALEADPEFHRQGANPAKEGPDLTNAKQVYEFLTSKFNARILKDSGERVNKTVPNQSKDYYGAAWEGNWNGPQDQDLGIGISKYIRDGRGKMAKCKECDGTGEVWTDEIDVRQRCVDDDHTQRVHTECFEVPIPEMDEKADELENEFEHVKPSMIDATEPGVVKRRMMTCQDATHRETCPECSGKGRMLETHFERSFGPIMEAEASTRELQVIQLAIDWIVKQNDGDAPEPSSVLRLFKAVEDGDHDELVRLALGHLKPLLADRQEEQIVVHEADSDEFASNKPVAEVTSEPTPEAVAAGEAKIEAALSGRGDPEATETVATV